MLRQLYDWLTRSEGNIYFIGILSTAFAALFGNVPTLLGGVEVFHQSNVVHFAELIGTNGYFWPLLSYTTAMGGSMLLTSSIAGVLLMRMEDISYAWYLKHVAPKVLAGFCVGFVLLILIIQGVIWINQV